MPLITGHTEAQRVRQLAQGHMVSKGGAKTQMQVVLLQSCDLTKVMHPQEGTHFTLIMERREAQRWESTRKESSWAQRWLLSVGNRRQGHTEGRDGSRITARSTLKIAGVFIPCINGRAIMKQRYDTKWFVHGQVYRQENILKTTVWDTCVP